MAPNKLELAALTRIFSATVLRDLARSGQSPLLARLFAQAGLKNHVAHGATVGHAFDLAFSRLRVSGNRDEYIYRAAIIEKVLLGRHSLRTASVVHEFRAGDCKADVVVLNGTSTAYEIKSERDSLARLPNQLANYSRVFAAVNVVVSPSHVRAVLDLAPADVGVLVLSRRFTIQTEREALNAPNRVSPLAVLASLRTGEALDVLRSMAVETPDVPNTRLRGELEKLFQRIDPTTLHEATLEVLKASRSQSSIADFVAGLPSSIRTGVLAAQLNESGRRRVLTAIHTPFDRALAWI